MFLVIDRVVALSCRQQSAVDPLWTAAACCRERQTIGLRVISAHSYRLKQLAELIVSRWKKSIAKAGLEESLQSVSG